MGVVIGLFAALFVFAAFVIVRIERMSRPVKIEAGVIAAKQFIPAHLEQIPADYRGGVAMRSMALPDQWAFDLKNDSHFSPTD